MSEKSEELKRDIRIGLDAVEQMRSNLLDFNREKQRLSRVITRIGADIPDMKVILDQIDEKHRGMSLDLRVVENQLILWDKVV